MPPRRNIDENARQTLEYLAGYKAFAQGLTRADCPHKSGCLSGDGFNKKREAWMLGHLDAEYEAKWEKPRQ